jgi:hypothetical protein
VSLWRLHRAFHDGLRSLLLNAPALTCALLEGSPSAVKRMLDSKRKRTRQGFMAPTIAALSG